MQYNVPKVGVTSFGIHCPAVWDRITEVFDLSSFIIGKLPLCKEKKSFSSAAGLEEKDVWRVEGRISIDLRRALCRLDTPLLRHANRPAASGLLRSAQRYIRQLQASKTRHKRMATVTSWGVRVFGYFYSCSHCYAKRKLPPRKRESRDMRDENVSPGRRKLNYQNLERRRTGVADELKYNTSNENDKKY